MEDYTKLYDVNAIIGDFSANAKKVNNIRVASIAIIAVFGILAIAAGAIYGIFESIGKKAINKNNSDCE